jgi:hypothetical protein
MNCSFPPVLSEIFYFIHFEKRSWCTVKIKEFKNGSCVLFESDIMEFSAVTDEKSEIIQSG